MYNKKQFEVFRKEVEEALKGIEEKWGVDIKPGKIKYSENDFGLELKVSKKEINGESFELAEFKKDCFLFGFSESDYNKEFIVQGKKFILTGFNLNAKSMPVLAKCLENGKTYKFKEDIKKLIA